jgi:hypothetical protein
MPIIHSVLIMLANSITILVCGYVRERRPWSNVSRKLVWTWGTLVSVELFMPDGTTDLLMFLSRRPIVILVQ